jgi:threonine/homoserine efflux transporter RhtA
MLQLTIVLAIALPFVGLLAFAILHQRKDNKIAVRIPSQSDWYK